MSLSALSMSEETWPNWNAMDIKYMLSPIQNYPCLKRRGPIETGDGLRW